LAVPFRGANKANLQDLTSVRGSRETIRHAEDLRGLLGRVPDEVEELHPQLREVIERALG